MKRCLLLVLSFLFMTSANAADKDSTVYYDLPDSVKAVQFMTEIKITSVTAKHFTVGISATGGSVYFLEFKGNRSIYFETNKFSSTMAVGNGVVADRNIKGSFFRFNYKWELNKTYKLLIAIAADSAANFYLGSGYVFLPDENKWKFLGTSRQYGNTSLKNPQVYSYNRKGFGQYSVGDPWIQRQNGSWKNLKGDNSSNPIINLYGHLDSVQQHKIDKKMIEDAIASGKTDVKDNLEGVYYKMIKEGTGKQVSLNDTITVHYRLSLFNDTTVIQQTKDGPATFPLKRLIKGWQIGVPLCKVGGKIKLVIPSDLAYSIRTRAADIPPNSILVFEIEVLEAR